MLPPTAVSSYDDDQLLTAVQLGDDYARNALRRRFEPLLRGMVVRLAPALAARHRDFADEVVSEAYALILDSRITRFKPERGRAVQYLFGLVRNAFRTVLRERRAVCIDLRNDERIEPTRAKRAAGVVYHNLRTARLDMPADAATEIRERMRIVFSGAEPEIECLASRHFFGGESITCITAGTRASRSTLSRRFADFLAGARHRLALAGAA